MTIDELNGEFGIPGSVTFEAGNNGMPKVALKHASGATAEVYLQGAHVTSWTNAHGEEMLFLSRKSWFEPGKAIRGGIPVIFPQFGDGPLPKHGFARTSEWQITKAVEGGEDAGDYIRLEFQLTESPETMAIWPHKFDLRLSVWLTSNILCVQFSPIPAEDDPFPFQAVLHTYFRVGEIERTSITGLQGVTYIDSLLNNLQEVETRDEIRIAEEVDRIYVNAQDTVRLMDEGNGRSIDIRVRGLPDVVVWNPWIDKSKRLEDFDDDEYRNMVCIETGAIVSPWVPWGGTTNFISHALEVTDE
jgi:glucose-6-phosphate 1-epimerase